MDGTGHGLRAAYSELRELLAATPGGKMAWADVMFAMGMSLETARSWLATMAVDPDSPLRTAVDDELAREVLRVRVERGRGVGGNVRGLIVVSLTAPLTQAEQTRVVSLVRRFCEPRFRPSKRFGHNCHAVANAVRRACGAYLTSCIPVGASVLEVGPDVASWAMEATPPQWAGRYVQMYKGARPILGPRDSVRVKWAELFQSAVDKEGFFSEQVLDKMGRLRESYDSVFSTARVEVSGLRGEYIKSLDANYDIDFSDMPRIMVGVGARAWLGVMVRARGLTSTTRMVNGKIDMMGMSYCVDWEENRIDFRYVDSHSFGYSHKVREYMKYEQHNGFVWTTSRAHYVYSKSTETTDELLFFGVHRVTNGLNLSEPVYAPEPWAGHVLIESPWAVGDEVDGVPRSFAQVKFHVDATNYARVLEKRRNQDHRGNIMATITFIRSSCVKFWLNGVPVGATGRVATRLIEALAVAVESVVSEDRQNAAYAFTTAEAAFKQARRGNVATLGSQLDYASGACLARLCSSVVDTRYVTGGLSMAVSRAWKGFRNCFVDSALSKSGKMRVRVEYVGDVQMVSPGGPSHEPVGVDAGGYSVPSMCTCGLRAEASVALAYAEADEIDELRAYLDSLPSVCADCVKAVDEAVEEVSTVPPTETETSVSEVESDTDVTSCGTDVEEGDTRELEIAAMEEFIAAETYKLTALKSEVRVSACRVFSYGYFTTAELKRFSDARTRHYLLKVVAGKVVEKRGADFDTVGAVFDRTTGEFVKVRQCGPNMAIDVPDGLYYSSSRMEVWNAEEVNQAVEHAIGFARAGKGYRRIAEIVIGVPGAGKTYSMVKRLAAEWQAGDRRKFRVLAMTRKSVEDAARDAVKFGIPEEVVGDAFKTVDSYLMHDRGAAEKLCVDEFPMAHIGKTDAVASLAGAHVVRLCGDGKQVPWSTFNEGFPARLGSIRTTALRSQITFLPETHRNPKDVCAMWVDQYPAYYPCECCRPGEKDGRSLEHRRVKSVAEIPRDMSARYHGYKKEDRDGIREALNLRGSLKDLKTAKRGGLSTVAEDQGSTHEKVISVRTNVVYDKHAAKPAPSVYNREAFVLTDTTRHTHSYVRVTLCDEVDLVERRIKMSMDPGRILAVEEKRSIREVDVLDLLA